MKCWYAFCTFVQGGMVVKALPPPHLQAVLSLPSPEEIAPFFFAAWDVRLPFSLFTFTYLLCVRGAVFPMQRCAFERAFYSSV